MIELVRQIQTDYTSAPVLGDNEQPEPACEALILLLAVSSVEQENDLTPPMYDDEDDPREVEAVFSDRDPPEPQSQLELMIL